jgi:phosphonate transport system ATP-binding protein
MFAVETSNLCKTYGDTSALDDVSVTVEPGEMVSLIGPSGAGKSTLLRHLSGLSASDSNESYVKVLGQTVQKNGDLNAHIRAIRSDVGFIFQQFNLVGRLPLLTNVLTGMLSRVPTWRSLLRFFTYEEKKCAMAALDRVGMAKYASQRASTLSGGQQQRAAIARALVQEAKIITADEPIASLDPESARKVMQNLRDINEKDGVTVLVSLHQVDFAMRFCRRCIGMREGRVVFDGSTAELDTATLRGIYGSEYSDVQEGVDMFAHLAEKGAVETPLDRSTREEAEFLREAAQIEC